MCQRIRTLGFTILHVDRPMTGHDLAMTRFSQYWRRAVRSGYAYAEVSTRFRNTDLPLWGTKRAAISFMAQDCSGSSSALPCSRLLSTLLFRSRQQLRS